MWFEIQTQNPIEKYVAQLTSVSVFGKFELLNKGDVGMKIYVIVKETQTTVGVDSYWSHENVKAFSSKQDAEFELKFTYRVDCFQSDVHFSIEEMELN